MYAIKRNLDNVIVVYGLHKRNADKLVKRLGKDKYMVVLNG